VQSHIHSAVCDGLLPDISKLGRALALHAWMARLMSPVWEDSKLFKHALAQQVIRFCVNPSWLCLHARFPRPSTCLIRLQLSFLLPYCDILWFGATTKTWALLMRQSLENPQLI
jgi:hypothetical protein